MEEEKVHVTIQCIRCGKLDSGVIVLDRFKVPDYLSIIFPYVCPECEKVAKDRKIELEVLQKVIDITQVRILKSIDRLN